MLLNTFNFLAGMCGAPAAEGAAESTGGMCGSGNPVMTILLMVGMVAIMYFVMIRPQKKKQQEEQKLRDSVQIGDEITTIGGINGRVVTVKEDSIVLETGADRTKMKIMRWAIQTNNTANERAESEKAAFEAAKAAEKEEKKASKRRSKKSDEE